MLLTAAGRLVNVTAADKPWLKNNPAENPHKQRVIFRVVQYAVVLDFIINSFAFDSKDPTNGNKAQTVGKLKHSCVVLLFQPPAVIAGMPLATICQGRLVGL